MKRKHLELRVMRVQPEGYKHSKKKWKKGSILKKIMQKREEVFIKDDFPRDKVSKRLTPRGSRNISESVLFNKVGGDGSAIWVEEIEKKHSKAGYGGRWNWLDHQ